MGPRAAGDRLGGSGSWDGRSGYRPAPGVPGHAGRSLRREAAHHRHDRHRQRAGRPDVDGPVARLREQFDIEGLVATTSTWMRNTVRPDVIHSVLDAYAQVQPNLLAACARVSDGRRAARSWSSGTAGVRHGRGRPRQDDRRLGSDPPRRPSDPIRGRSGCSAWGGTNTLAQALLHARAPRTRRRARRVRLEAARLLDLRPGRCGAVDPPRVPDVCTTSRRRRRRTASSTTSRRGPASAAIASTATRRRRLHDVHRRVGERPTSARRGRSASSIRIRAASTRATRRRFSA